MKKSSKVNKWKMRVIEPMITESLSNVTAFQHQSVMDSYST